MEPTDVFIIMVIFWTCITIGSNLLVDDLNEMGSDLAPYDTDSQFIDEDTLDAKWKNFFTGIFDTLDTIPVLKFFTPVLKILTVNYTAAVPWYLSVILNALTILSAFVGYIIIFKKG